MASIKITPDQFADIVIALLLDAMSEKENILADNEEFYQIIDKMKRSGMKAPLLSYYISTSSIVRNKYKVIRPSFTDEGASNTIVIDESPDKKSKDDPKASKIKTLVKKALKLIRSHKLRRNSGIPLNEETVDKIIDKLLKEEIGE